MVNGIRPKCRVFRRVGLCFDAACCNDDVRQRSSSGHTTLIFGRVNWITGHLQSTHLTQSCIGYSM